MRRLWLHEHKGDEDLMVDVTKVETTDDITYTFTIDNTDISLRVDKDANCLHWVHDVRFNAPDQTWQEFRDEVENSPDINIV